MRLRVLFFHDNHLKTVLITVATLGDSPNNRNSFLEIIKVLFCYPTQWFLGHFPNVATVIRTVFRRLVKKSSIWCEMPTSFRIESYLVSAFFIDGNGEVLYASDHHDNS